MIPPLAGSATQGPGKALRITKVTGGEKTNPWDLSKIEDEGFLEALVETLKNSGLFKTVVKDQPGDYELYAQIISQDAQGTGVTASYLLFVNYRLIDGHSRQELWKENILSQYDTRFEESFFGAERRRRGNEGVVRNNLVQLVKKLSQVLNR